MDQVRLSGDVEVDAERTEHLGEASIIPDKWRWDKLAPLAGDELELQYRHTLENLAKEKGLIGTIFRKAQNKLTDPAKLKRVVSLIDAETWIGIGVDGCSVPVFRIPLASLALLYARLSGGRAPRETAREFAARTRIVRAMTRAPLMVAGTGRFTTKLMLAFRGRLLAKEGAEGVYAVGASRSLRRTLPGRGAVGIALKIEDGSERGRDAVTVEVLRQIGLASGPRLAALRLFANRPVRSVRGDVVGGMTTLFTLERFAADGSSG